MYTSRFFRIQNFTPKVRDPRQIQCYQKCTVRDKFNPKKVKKKQGETVKHTHTFGFQLSFHQLGILIPFSISDFVILLINKNFTDFHYVVVLL